MQSRRTYSLEDKVAALLLLDLHRGNVKRAALAAGVPRKTLSQWKNGKGVSAEVVSLHYRKGSDLAARIEHALHLMIDAMIETLPDKIERGSLSSLAQAVGVTVDRMQLLRGQPTRIVVCPSCRARKAS